MTSVCTRLVQMEVVPGRPRANTQQMLAALEQARADGVALVVFPELAIPGCLMGDEWERSAFLRECEACGEEVRAASAGIVAVFGNIAVDWTRRNEDGRVRKYNALFFAEDGRWLTPEGCGLPYVVKTLQPNYREFDDTRHFFDTRRLATERGVPVETLIAPVATQRAGRLGGMLCEDAWDGDYATSPGRMLAGKGAERLIIASCSPFTRGKLSKRFRVCRALAQATQLPVLYVNNIGVQDIGKTVYTFDGGSGFYDCTGKVIEGLPGFEAGVLTQAVPGGAVPFAQAVTTASGDGVADVAQAILYGTATFMRRLGIRRVVIGVSGGIDSAVAAAIYARLVPPENLLLVNMPGPFTSRTTRGLAGRLAENLGSRSVTIPIDASVAWTEKQFAELKTSGPAPGGGALSLDGAAMENVQSRDRGGRILAAAAAAFGGVIACNANKSEITVGYGTLYGDILGWLAAIGDLWKGEVYELGRHLNEAVYGREVIPQGIFDIVPSAELSQAQSVDQGLGDPLIYPYHDCLFRAWVERWERATPEEILEWYLDGVLEKQIGYAGNVQTLFPDAAHFIADLERWWNLHQGLAIAKRMQAPPILAVSRRAFGFDLREAQLGPRYTARYGLLRRKAVQSACTLCANPS
jgi:NAD+ synthase (glutamine-hydrolysing)